MKTLDKDSLIGVSALLVHAAKIDEIYSDKEKFLIKDWLLIIIITLATTFVLF